MGRRAPARTAAPRLPQYMRVCCRGQQWVLQPSSSAPALLRSSPAGPAVHAQASRRRPQASCLGARQAAAPTAAPCTVAARASWVMPPPQPLRHAVHARATPCWPALRRSRRRARPSSPPRRPPVLAAQWWRPPAQTRRRWARPGSTGASPGRVGAGAGAGGGRGSQSAARGRGSARQRPPALHPGRCTISHQHAKARTPTRKHNTPRRRPTWWSSSAGGSTCHTARAPHRRSPSHSSPQLCSPGGRARQTATR